MSKSDTYFLILMQEYTVGYGHFDKYSLQQAFQKLLTQDVVEVLQSKQEWNIIHKEYQYLHWDIIFSHMLQSRVDKIELGRNYHPNMIKDINCIKFTCLRFLCFGKNNIINIEPIVSIDAPQLAWISFEENFITSLKPLRKAYFPKLKVLSLKCNKLPIVDLSALYAPHLSKLILEFHYEQARQGEGLEWITKLQTTNLTILRCRNSKRIPNRLTEGQLLAKYRNLDIKKSNESDPNSDSQSDQE